MMASFCSAPRSNPSFIHCCVKALTAALHDTSSKLVSSAVSPSTPAATKAGKELEEGEGLLKSAVTNVLNNSLKLLAACLY